MSSPSGHACGDLEAFFSHIHHITPVYSNNYWQVSGLYGVDQFHVAQLSWCYFSV